MPVATLTFNLPEEQQEFDTVVKAVDMSIALHEIGQEVFRPARKHGYSDARIQELLTTLDNLAEPLCDYEKGVYVSATELVSLLEREFYRILNERGIAELV